MKVSKNCAFFWFPHLSFLVCYWRIWWAWDIRSPSLPPTRTVQFLSFSCSFGENCPNSGMGAHALHPANPGSATVCAHGGSRDAQNILFNKIQQVTDTSSYVNCYHSYVRITSRRSIDMRLVVWWRSSTLLWVEVSLPTLFTHTRFCTLQNRSLYMISISRLKLTNIPAWSIQERRDLMSFNRVPANIQPIHQIHTVFERIDLVGKLLKSVRVWHRRKLKSPWSMTWQNVFQSIRKSSTLWETLDQVGEIFCWKLHKNERNWIEKEGGVPSAPFCIH